MRNKLLGAFLLIILVICYLFLNDYMNDSEKNKKEEEKTKTEASMDLIYYDNNMLDYEI